MDCWEADSNSSSSRNNGFKFELLELLVLGMAVPEEIDTFDEFRL